MTEEGYVPVDGGRLYYRRFGTDGSRAAVLGLHGGPGSSLDYMSPFADLAKWGFPVVLFDQLGCGRSDVPADHSLFTTDHHVRETEAVRAALGLGEVHLIGSSYGGLLALAYTLAHPSQVRSLTTVGGVASVPFLQGEMDRLKRELPPTTRAALARHEAAGSFGDPEYLDAVMEFYRRHVCRIEPWPSDLMATFELTNRAPVYGIMNGPNEFTISGTIRDIDLTPRLGEIRAPTLVLGGRHDEVTPAVAQQIATAIPGARGVTFEGSSHLPFWEERDRFFQVLSGFLLEVESRPRSGTIRRRLAPRPPRSSPRTSDGPRAALARRRSRTRRTTRK